MNKNDALTERYEELRQRALGQHPGGTMWGLVVLRTRGMATWVRTWQEHTDVPHVRAKVSAPSVPPLVAAGDELVRVLAAMVWAFHEETVS
jgi:hypothetical protein